MPCAGLCAARMANALTIRAMTTKERLHKLVDELSEAEADETLRFAVAHHEGRNVDEWGDMDAQTDALFADTMRTLAEEERAAGFGPWKREPTSGS